MEKKHDKRMVYRLATTFSSVFLNTREITTDILDELINDNSRSSNVVDSFEGMGNSQDAAGTVLIILYEAKQAKTINLLIANSERHFEYKIKLHLNFYIKKSFGKFINMYSISSTIYLFKLSNTVLQGYLIIFIINNIIIIIKIKTFTLLGSSKIKS